MRHFWDIFFSHLIFLLLFWYNIVIAVIFICIVEMMCDKCDNFFFLRFFHTLKYNLVFWFFFRGFFFLSYKMKYQWQQQNFDPHRLSTIVSSSSYILSNIFKKPPEFLVWGEEKRKTKVTVFKEGRGNIFFYRVRFSMLKVQSNLQLYSSRSSEK